MKTRAFVACFGLLVAVVFYGTPVARGQSLLERTPNLYGTAIPTEKAARFTLLHRFELVGEDNKKVLNYPTFTLGVGLPYQFAVGATYASNSEIGAGTLNEWEVWGRRRLEFGPRADMAVMVAYNTAAESVDGEVAGRVRLSRFSFHGAVRVFSSAYGTDDSAAALGGGVLFHLTPRLAVGSDVTRVVSTDTLPTAWSGGVHFVIPGSPHTLGFVVSNVGATTLQGASRGIEELDGGDVVRYGFAFTMPIGTLGQWVKIFHGDPATAVDDNVVTIRDFAFGLQEIRIQAGETVRWVNDDQVAHSVTADDESFDSGLLNPGEGYSRRFDEPGRYGYYCTPHPFMKATIVVEQPY